jgi:hypothetical protein
MTQPDPTEALRVAVRGLIAERDHLQAIVDLAVAWDNESCVCGSWSPCPKCTAEELLTAALGKIPGSTRPTWDDRFKNK